RVDHRRPVPPPSGRPGLRGDRRGRPARRPAPQPDRTPGVVHHRLLPPARRAPAGGRRGRLGPAGPGGGRGPGLDAARHRAAAGRPGRPRTGPPRHPPGRDRTEPAGGELPPARRRPPLIAPWWSPSGLMVNLAMLRSPVLLVVFFATTTADTVFHNAVDDAHRLHAPAAR